MSTRWPEHLHPGALRWARSSPAYSATVAFYRDLVGLPVVDTFTDSFGSDGTIFGLPDTGVQLEIVRGSGSEPPANDLDQLVLYLDDADAVEVAAAPLRAAERTPDPEQHPYWAANGAVTYRDPDGRGVVFAPWVYGRDPEPAEPHPRPSRLSRTNRLRTTATGRRCGRCSRRPRTPPTQLDSYIDAGPGAGRLADEVRRRASAARRPTATSRRAEEHGGATEPARRRASAGALVEAALRRPATTASPA